MVRKKPEKNLPSTREQRRSLRKKGISLKGVKGKWTVYSLYRYYIGNKKKGIKGHPKTDPRYLAYRSKDRFEERLLHAKNPEKKKVKIGTGEKVPYTKIVDKERGRLDKETEQILMPNMRLTMNHEQPSRDKALDMLHIDIDHVVNEQNFTEEMKKIKAFVDNTIIPTIERMLAIRKKYYDQGEHLIGVKINFKTLQGMKTYAVHTEYENGHTVHVKDKPSREVVVTKFHTTVVYRDTHDSIHELSADLKDSIEQGAHKVFDYNNLELVLENIEVGIVSRQQMNALERLRVR